MVTESPAEVLWTTKLKVTLPPGSATFSGLAVLTLAYYFREPIRWHLIAGGWLLVMLAANFLRQLLHRVANQDVREGLYWYGIGCGILLLALLVSLWKAGIARRWIAWAQKQETAAQS